MSKSITNIPMSSSPESVWATLQAMAQDSKRWREEYEQREKERAEREKEREKERAEREKEREKERAEREKAEDQRRAKEAADWAVRIKKLEDLVGNTSNNNGHFAEEYFYNALSSSLCFGGVKYDSMVKNKYARSNKVEDEFDILLLNGTSVAIIEIKYRVHQNYLEQLVNKKVPNFRSLFAEYANHRIYLGIGSLSFNDKVIEQARQLGIGMLKQKGDTVECDTAKMTAY